MTNTMREVHGGDPAAASAAGVDMKLEVVIIPVSDVDRAKEFYKKLGWRLDATPPTVVQFTPPGSWCSIQFGKNLTSGRARFRQIVRNRFGHRDRP
jgi:catechol 2,3-dioxygenase-like lactoylglutathione lyase family enzyme